VTAAAATSKASQTAQEEKEQKGLVQGRHLLGLGLTGCMRSMQQLKLKRQFDPNKRRATYQQTIAGRE
jgi:hypothetical protein